MDSAVLLNFVSQKVDAELIPVLSDYVRIPSLSPSFDPEWETNGHMENAMNVLVDWVKAQPIKDMSVEIYREPHIPPMVFVEIPATDASFPTVLMYGHMDKQPHFTGWLEGVGPTTPGIIGDLLYGRGCADDGYALPGAVLAVLAVQEQNLPHGRIVIIAENEEESDSSSLVYLVQKLKPKIGEPDIIICLDSGAGNYEQLWVTKSLRGICSIDLNVKVLDEGVHSGDGSGVIPSSVRVMRQLLDRLEDARTGRVLVESMHKPLTPNYYSDAAAVADALGADLLSGIKFSGSTRPMHTDAVELILNKTQRPTLSYIGADHLPKPADSGNLIRCQTCFVLSFRLPPGVDNDAIEAEIRQKLLHDVPSGANVELKINEILSGFEAPCLQPWLEQRVNEASHAFFGKDCLYFGEGGSIPFMGYLRDVFPSAQFIVTGVLGPGSNAHSSNETLHIPFTKKLISSIAYVITGSPN